jgi:hypothetical protein
MAESIFNSCEFSITDIKHLYIGARQLNGNPIEFPLEYITKTGTTESVIRVQEWNPSANYALIGGQYVEWTQVPNLGNNISFEESYEEGKQGKTYVKNLGFDLPNVNFTTNAVLKSFLFSASGNFAISNAIAFLVDSNDQQWLVGYDIPLLLQDGMELSIANENHYKLSFQSISYSRSRNYEIDS